MVSAGVSAFITIFLMQQVAAPEPAPLLDPSGLLYFELREDARQLYILGEYSTAGLLYSQRKCIEDQFLKWKSSSQKKAMIDLCFSFEPHLSDLDFDFNRVTQADPLWVEKFYTQNLELLPESDRNGTNVRRRNLLEIKYKTYLLQNPIFGESLPLPGWDQNDQIAIEELLISDEEISSALEEKELSRKSFVSIYQKLHPEVSSDDVFLAYLRYYFFGRRLLYRWNFKDWMNELSNPPRLSKAEFSIFKKQEKKWREDAEFYEMIWQASQKSVLIDWNAPSGFESEQRSGFRWIYAQFGRNWPRFSEEFPILELAKKFSNAETDPRLPLLPLEIDQFVFESGFWDLPEYELFKKARAETETLRWLEIETSKSAYRALPDELRTILAIQYFPQLTVKAARRILDGNFFELPKSEQLHSLQRFFISYSQSADTPDAIEKWIQQYETSDLLQLSNRNELLAGLVKLSLQHRDIDELKWTEPDGSQILTFDGRLLPTSESERDLMRSMIQETKEEKSTQKIDYGWYPEFLIDSMMIHLFPSPNYWGNEKDKFWNELSRQEKLWDFRKIQKQLDKDPDATDEQKAAIRTELRNLFKTEKGVARLDPSSLGVWSACFWAGLKHNPTRAITNVIAGGVITYVFKWAGARWAMVYIVADGAIRFQTAAAQNPDTLEWYEIDLSKGYSTPVGKFFAQSVQEIYQTGTMVFDPADPMDRLEGFYHSGELLFDFATFSVGSGLMNRALAESSLSWRRGLKRANEFYTRAEGQVKKFEERVKKLDEEISMLEAERLQAKASQLEDLSRRLDVKRYERLQFEAMLEEKRPSRPKFWLRQGTKLVGRVLENVLFLRWMPSIKVLKPSKFVNYWRRDAHLTRGQVTHLLEQAERFLEEAQFKLPAESRMLLRKSTTASEREAFTNPRIDRVTSLAELTEKFEKARDTGKLTTKNIQRLASELEAAIKDEEISLQLLDRMEKAKMNVVEKATNLNERSFIQEHIPELRAATLARAARMSDTLSAIESQLRYSSESRLFSRGLTNSRRFNQISLRIRDLRQDIQMRILGEPAGQLSRARGLSTLDYWKSLAERSQPTRQVKLDTQATMDLIRVSKIETNPPSVLRKLDGTWYKIEIAGSPEGWQAFARKALNGNHEIFFMRKIFNEWRVIDRQWVIVD